MRHSCFTTRSMTLTTLVRTVAPAMLMLGSLHCALGSNQVSGDGGGRADVRYGADGQLLPTDGAPSSDAAVIDPPDASVSPAYLPNRRAYDNERDYVSWEGPVSYVTMTHRDNTSLPAEEGGASCTGGCSEQVTHIEEGGCVSGNFTNLCGFRFQLAYEPGAGTATVTACDQTVGTFSMAGSGTPGFNNLPPAGPWIPPTRGACTWRICATSGFVDFRAVTPTYCVADAPPAVDLRVNGTDGPIMLEDPASYTLSWTSTNAVSCVTSGAWTGGVASAGAQAVHDRAAGSYTHTITCVNSLGSATDAVTVEVQRPPG